MDAHQLAHAVHETMISGESPYIAVADAANFTALLMKRGVVITNAEGYVLEADRDIQQDDLIVRYDARLHISEQALRPLSEAAAEFMLRNIERARATGRLLHFKFFVRV